MSIASEITRLQGAKADIKTAIEGKGVTVPSSALLDEYDTYIGQITTETPVNEAIQLWSAREVDGELQHYRTAIIIGDVTTIPTETCQNDTELLEAMIPDTITHTGTSTFDGCSSLRRVNLENVETIGDYCFRNCEGLTSVDVLNVEEFGAYCFSGCSNLTDVNFGDKVTTIRQRAFNGVPITGDISFPDLTGVGIRAFYSTDITSVSNLGSLTRTYDEAFRTCTSLESVVLPSTIKNIVYMTFYNCPLLDWVTILATTPPNLGSSVFGQSYRARVRVPYSADHSVLADYREAESWTAFANRVYECDPPNLYPLPDDYTELDHITCDGTQWLDTGLVGNQGVSTDISIYSDYTNTAMSLFGRNTGDSATSVLVNIANSSGTTRLGGASRAIGWGSRPDWEASLRYNGLARNTGWSSWSSGSVVGEFTTGDNMLLGWNGSSSSNKFKGDIQSCRIWMSGILARDFKPCKNASNVVGMWDAVNGVFYGSASGTDFTE